MVKKTKQKQNKKQNTSARPKTNNKKHVGKQNVYHPFIWKVAEETRTLMRIRNVAQGQKKYECQILF